MYSFCPVTDVAFSDYSSPTSDAFDSSDIYTFAFLPDSSGICVGGSNGVCKLFNLGESGSSHSATLLNTFLTQDVVDAPMPCTAISFRPDAYPGQYYDDAPLNQDYYFLTAFADGSIRQYSTLTGSCFYQATEEDNQIFALQYDATGLSFVTAGKDATVRVYDEETKTLSTTLLGHSNRVFAAAFTADSTPTIVSGGWDSTVRVWDVRTGKSELQAYGYSICSSHALATHPTDAHTIAVAPSKSGQPCAILDIRNMSQPVLQLSLNPRATPYTCAFHPSGSLVAAGGSGEEQAHVFAVDSGEECARVDVGGEGVYGVGWSPDGRWLGACGKASRMGAVHASLGSSV